MAWTWTNTASSGAKALTALVTELQNAVKQLAADVYTTPTNAGTGAGQLTTPLETSGGATSANLKAGASTSNGSTGVAITFGTAMADANYSVQVTFTADPGGDVGQWYITNKLTTGFTVKTQGPTATAFTWLCTPYQNA